VRDNNYLVLLNAHHESVDFKIPKSLSKSKWRVELNTAQPAAGAGPEVVRRIIKIEGRSLVVLVSDSEPPDTLPENPSSA
jgi:isoamylase